LSLVQIQEAGDPASFRYLPEHIRPLLVGILGVNRLARAEFENPLPYLDDLFSMADQVHLDATFVRIPEGAMFEVLDVNRRSTLALTQLWCSLSHSTPINGPAGRLGCGQFEA
jgi:hypothetical protein